MKPVTEVFVLLCLASLGGGATYFWHPQAPALHVVEEPLRDDEVSLSQIESEWGGDVIWLDARSSEQYAKGHVPGAHLLNEQGFLDQLVDLLDVLQTAERPVVIYCDGARCEASRRIRSQLITQLPLENVWVLKGGWPAWTAAAGRVAEVD